MSDEAVREALTPEDTVTSTLSRYERQALVVAEDRQVSDEVHRELAAIIRRLCAELQGVKRERDTAWHDALDAVEKVMGWEEPSYAWWLALRLRHPRPSAQERAP